MFPSLDSSHKPIEIVPYVVAGATEFQPKGRFPFKLGRYQADIWGGPYRQCPPNRFGIKMAEEIQQDCLISVPTKDFHVPDSRRFMAGLATTFPLIQMGVPLYVGCMGGIGRTGLFFAGLAKVMAGYQKATKKKPIHPVSYVRQTYFSHAVETEQQMAYIRDLDVSMLVDWWLSNRNI